MVASGSSGLLTVAKFLYLLYAIPIFFNLSLFSQALFTGTRKGEGLLDAGGRKLKPCLSSPLFIIHSPAWRIGAPLDEQVVFEPRSAER